MLEDASISKTREDSVLGLAMSVAGGEVRGIIWTAALGNKCGCEVEVEEVERGAGWMPGCTLMPRCSELRLDGEGW